MQRFFQPYPYIPPYFCQKFPIFRYLTFHLGFCRILYNPVKINIYERSLYTLAALISSVTSLVTAAVGWLTSWVGSVTAEGNEVLLLFVVAVPLVGLGIGALKRLISV